MSDEIAWDKTVSDVNDGILAATGKPHPMYYGALGLSLTCLLIGIVAWALQITYLEEIRYVIKLEYLYWMCFILIE